MNVFLRPLCLGLLSAMAAALPVSAAVHALVVGVNDYGSPDTNLSSCVADAKAFAQFLQKGFGVPASNIRVLLDREAGSDAIEAAFRETLIRGVAPDDQVVFYFSGHGALTPNLTTVTARRVDKALVPARLPKPPLAWEQLLPQSRIDGWLAESPARRQVVVLDCCHSGALTRSLGGNPDFRPKVLDLGFAASEAALIPGVGEPAFSKQAGGKTLLWLGACESKQVSYTGRPYSLFTGKLLKALQGSPGTPVRDVFASVAAQVVEASKGLPQGAQNPQSEGATEQPLLLGALPASGSAPAAAVPPASAANTNRNTSIFDSLSLANRTNAPGVATVTLDSLRIAPNRIPPAPNPFQVKARLDRSVYVTNELPVLTIESSEDAFVRVFIVAADATQTQIFPNRWQPDNRVRKGEPFRIPGAAENRWRLRITEPFGTEIVMVQARREQFVDLAKGVEYTGLFQDLGSESPAQSRARGMKAEEIAPVTPPQSSPTAVPAVAPSGRAEAVVSYQVVASRP
jgi:uncharacterized caspase-like protein